MSRHALHSSERLDSIASLTIISGPPGAGKTTLAARLAKSSPCGLHLPADLFYSFPAHPLDPTRPEANTQNEAIIAALGAAAGSFLASGFDVFLDGIVGPWFLTTLLAPIPPTFGVAYVLLTTDEATALERVRAREGSGESARVLSMHAASARSRAFRDHEIETTDLDADVLANSVQRMLLDGRLDLARASGSSAPSDSASR